MRNKPDPAVATARTLSRSDPANTPQAGSGQAGPHMSNQSLRGTAASDHLDMMRGLAALAVLVGHARALLMPSAVEGIGLGDRALYLLTGIATPAVMVFFVMSGFLVGGSVVRATGAGQWSWRDYLLARSLRLYLVLLPALLLAIPWDHAAQALAVGKTANQDTALAVLTVDQIAQRSTFVTFIGNLLFLQTILTETFGSNHALWSLANEAWYYLIFPCLWLAIRPSLGLMTRLAYGGAAVAMLCLVGARIASLFPVWLLGVAVAASPRLRWFESRWVTVAAALPFIASLLLYGTGRVLTKGLVGEYAVALCFTVFMLAVLHRREAGGLGAYSVVAGVLAGCSYTLYVSHLPVIVFLRSLWTLERPWTLDTWHWLCAALVCVGCLVYAFVLSRLTEAHTDRIRRWVKAKVDQTT